MNNKYDANLPCRNLILIGPHLSHPSGKLVNRNSECVWVTYLSNIKYSWKACIIRQLSSRPNPRGPSTQTGQKKNIAYKTEMYQITVTRGREKV